MTNIFKIKNPKNFKKTLKETVKILKNGGIILYPTDTVYGLGFDVSNKETLKRLYNLKKRDSKKPISIIVSDIEMAKKYAVFDDNAIALAKKFWPGALTLILPAKNKLLSHLNLSNKTIGIRIPNNYFCIELLKIFKKPISSTSANISGKKQMLSVNKILSKFDNINNIDLVVDAGPSDKTKPSTIIDLSGKNIKLLRKGVISYKNIIKELESSLLFSKNNY